MLSPLCPQVTVTLRSLIPRVDIAKAKMTTSTGSRPTPKSGRHPTPGCLQVGSFIIFSRLIGRFSLPLTFLTWTGAGKREPRRCRRTSCSPKGSTWLVVPCVFFRLCGLFLCLDTLSLAVGATRVRIAEKMQRFVIVQCAEVRLCHYCRVMSLALGTMHRILYAVSHRLVKTNICLIVVPDSIERAISQQCNLIHLNCTRSESEHCFS